MQPQTLPSADAIESSCFITWKDKRGICFTRVKRDAFVQLKDAVENKENVITLFGTETPPILVDLREILSISREAREYFAMKNRKAGVSAIAMIIKSPVSKTIGNLYLRINTPTVPTKLFTSEEKAIEFLKTFLRDG
jgi:hypothetical protein